MERIPKCCGEGEMGVSSPGHLPGVGTTLGKGEEMVGKSSEGNYRQDLQEEITQSGTGGSRVAVGTQDSPSAH